MPLAVPLARLDTPQRGRVAVRVFAGAHRMPGRRVATGKVALRTTAGIPCLRIGAQLAGRRRAGRGCGCTGFTATVVERTDDQRAVDVAFQEGHQYLLPYPWQELRTHPGAGVTLGNAQPT